jgi:probable selenium-dependent hydroxylase accessory protein YqeC
VSLLNALGLGRGDVVAVVGAGGKTTLVHRLADEARRAGLRALATSTTHMGTLPEFVTGPVVFEAEGDPLPALEDALRRHGRATLLGRRLREDKLEGVTPERVDELAPMADLVLVEADGARGRSLKLPASHEPVLPRSATVMLVVAALDVLGAPLDENWVHRLELVGDACGLARGEPLGPGEVARALGAAGGYLARVRQGVRAGVFLNKAEDAATLAAAEDIAARLAPPYAFVAAGSARAGECRILAPAPLPPVLLC